MQPLDSSKLRGLLRMLLVSCVSILLSLLVAAVIMLAVGYSPLAAYSALLRGAFGSVNSLANTLSKTVPLVFCGLSFAFAAKCGMFNIGGESQLYMGGIASAFVALALDGAPRYIVLTLAILAGMVAGGFMGSLLGLAKAKLQLNEVIVAIMLNYIAILFTSWVVNNPMKAEGSMTPQTEAISETYMFGKLIPRSQLTSALLLGIAFAVAVFFFFKSTRAGYNIRAVGQNRFAAAASGIGIDATMILSMAVSGGIAGLVGTTEVLGKYGRFIDGFSPGFGFTGIAVAVLANNNPIGILLTAFLFGVLDAGSLKMSYEAGISANMVMAIQGLVILFVATPRIAEVLMPRLRRKKAQGGQSIG